METRNIAKEIKAFTEIANEDVETGNPQTLNARRGRKNNAIETVKSLKKELRDSIMNNSMYIVVSGNGSLKFAEIASSKKFGLFMANGMEFYEDLANRIPEILYMNKDVTSSLFDTAGRHLEDKMGELDVNEYNQFLFRSEDNGFLKSKTDLINTLARSINAQVGAEVVIIQAVNSILEEAIEREHSAGITPIVLYMNNDAMAESIVKDILATGKKAFLVGAGSNDIPEDKAILVDLKNDDKKNTDIVRQVLTTIKKTV